MANVTTYLKQLKRGGFPALGTKIGVVDIDAVDISAQVATDTVELFTAEAEMLVLAAGIDVVTATTGASTGDLGDGTTADLFGDGMALNATGTKQDATYPGPQLLAAGAKMILTVADADPGGTGVVRPWAIVADVNDLSGD